MGPRSTTLLSLLLSTVAACGDRAVCDEAACQDVCTMLAGGTFDADSRRLLTPDEVRRLQTELVDLRQGARIDATRAGLCTGAAGCDTLLGLAPPPLAPGTYHLRVPYELPRRALPAYWQVSVHTSCVDADAHGSFELAEEQLSSSVHMLGDGAGVVDVPAFEIAAGARPRACAWRAFLEADGAEPTQIEGRYRTALPPEATTADAPPEDGAEGIDDAHP